MEGGPAVAGHCPMDGSRSSDVVRSLEGADIWRSHAKIFRILYLNPASDSHHHGSSLPSFTSFLISRKSPCVLSQCPPSPANHHTVSPPLSAIIATIPFLSLHRTSANINSTYHRIQVVQLNDDNVLLHSLSRHSGSFLRPMFQQLPMSL
ncbi:hypothetical protein L2E82_49415 [Cichorium intybus]|uniref:Uncharacterized protein n=1 Tax=Cichorium intybus TaxID=13427 RepID=A0ACB8Z1G3_CICIN|nr:hypothetical protein L2E82_49415 [Cichorium intybus]